MTELIDFLSTHNTIYIILIGIISVNIGSFLNVVIVRLPIMLQAAWQQECYEYLRLPNNQTNSKTTFNLIAPRSHCPNCKQQISILENIPVLSFIFLKGRCRYCHTKISIQYPLVEIICSVGSMSIAWHLGVSLQTVAGLFLTWCLICQASIDFKHSIIPDNISLPMLWLGLLSNSLNLFNDCQSAIIGAIFGYLSLWSLYWLFKLITGKEGMGFGDFKLLAMLGAWLGWQMLPLIILLSSLMGGIVGISLIVLTKHNRTLPIPFGPYLALAGWVALIWGEELNQWYLQVSGLV
jgi:leader peptidase (prepilin peptidase) / N-methyltransferase